VVNLTFSLSSNPVGLGTSPLEWIYPSLKEKEVPYWGDNDRTTSVLRQSKPTCLKDLGKYVLHDNNKNHCYSLEIPYLCIHGIALSTYTIFQIIVDDIFLKNHFLEHVHGLLHYWLLL
jgi:hypothetical protein